MSSKKITVILGSPRKAGNSAILANELIEGAKQAGAAVESVYLHGIGIEPCTACDSCRARSELDCIIDDSMQTLYPKLRATDVVVIASPVYWFTVSAQTKLFMDRCYALGGPEGNALKGKKIVIILTFAGEDIFDSGGVNALRTFEDGFGYIGAEIAGMLYGRAQDAGEIRKDVGLMQKARELGKQIGTD